MLMDQSPSKLSVDEIYISPEISFESHAYWEDAQLRQGQNSVLLFWQSPPCLVMGRFQNALLEVNFEDLKNKTHALYRRQSGGGCVYHGPGNLNVSWIGPREKFGPKALYQYLEQNLLTELEGRLILGKKYDWYLDQKKISGAAFKHTRERSLHHITLLCDSNLDAIASLLHHKRPLIESKSIASRPAEMTTLNKSAGISLEILLDRVSHKALPWKPLEPVQMSPPDSWQWLWAETPKFSFKTREGVVVFEKGFCTEGPKGWPGIKLGSADFFERFDPRTLQGPT